MKLEINLDHLLKAKVRDLNDTVDRFNGYRLPEKDNIKSASLEYCEKTGRVFIKGEISMSLLEFFCN